MGFAVFGVPGVEIQATRQTKSAQNPGPWTKRALSFKRGASEGLCGFVSRVLLRVLDGLYKDYFELGPWWYVQSKRFFLTSRMNFVLEALCTKLVELR